jgi:catechol 2,3-dioxygenase-like lactoylglutathione lyase family enzyme
MITGISHITLSVKHLARSYRFYVDVLGCKPIAKWPKGAYVTAGNIWVALHVDKSTRNGPLPEYTHIAFRVPARSFDALAARIRASRAKIFQENVTEGKSLYFLDPDGHKLEIHVGDLKSRLASAKKAPWKGLEFLHKQLSSCPQEV